MTEREEGLSAGMRNTQAFAYTLAIFLQGVPADPSDLGKIVVRALVVIIFLPPTFIEGAGWKEDVLQLHGQSELVEPLPAHRNILCVQDFAFSCW